MSTVQGRPAVDGHARAYAIAVAGGALWAVLLGHRALEATAIATAVLVGLLQQGLP